MKKILSFVLLLSIMITSLVSFTSCSEKDVNEGYITDEQREEHIAMLIGDKEIIAENVKTETVEVDDTGMEIIKTEEEWVIAKAYKNKEVGNKNATVDGVRRGTENMVLLMENKNYEFYMHLQYKTDSENMSSFAIVDKATGHVYHSNPVDTAGAYSTFNSVDAKVSDPIISPIAIEAYDISNKRYEFNYMQHCAGAKRLTIVKMDNDTIRVIYTIGNDPDADLVPPVITMETWAWLEARLGNVDGGAKHFANLKNCYKGVEPDKLTLEDKERFIDDYPTIEMFPMMIVRTLNVRQKQLVKDAMEAAGFNADMLKKEMDAVEYSGPARAVMFTIPVDFTLTEDGLSVTVDSNLILAPQKQKMYKIYLNRAFGSVSPSVVGSKITGSSGKVINNEQYIIIPDGSGAIMPAGGNLTTDVFTGRVYGLDDSFQVEYDITPEEQVVTPFLAFDRSAQGGMVAILSNGGAQAYATARPSNNTNNPGASINFDLVYAERSYLTYSGGQGGEEQITGSTSQDNSSSGAILSKEDNIAVFTVDYFFNEGDWTYADYANFYRDYLINKEILPANAKSDSTVPFYVDVLGAINKTESVVGVPMDHVVALTTYNQVKEIADALMDAGVENVNMRYLYWANDGYYNTIYDKVDLVSPMGSASELKEVSEYLQSKNVGFYPDANFIYVVKDEAFDSMNYSQDAARRLDMTVSRNLMRDYATGYTWRNGYDLTVISADKIPNMAAGFKADLEKLLSNKQISLGAIGSVIDSNYKIGRIINRTQALNYHIEALNEFEGYDMMIQTGNDYTWKYASHILNLPLGSSQYMSTSEAIPFIQMVLHGYINYAGDPLNEAADYSTALLEMLETGSGVYFKWMGAENSILNNTDYVFMDWYSVNYNDSFDIAVELYKEASALMNKVANKPITNHEILEAYHVYEGERTYYAEGDENYVEGELNASYDRIEVGNVYATTYGGSVKFIVNYNDFDVELADETTVVPANGYLEVNVK
ncbi:MAG: hypothetical protein E7481_00500 [Ruminococcaceae bacterium]|nr:hypothetical protein [Oscillospiraceae bacterium]